jgi:hypothetical protein
MTHTWDTHVDKALQNNSKYAFLHLTFALCPQLITSTHTQHAPITKMLLLCDLVPVFALLLLRSSLHGL